MRTCDACTMPLPKGSHHLKRFCDHDCRDLEDALTRLAKCLPIVVKRLCSLGTLQAAHCLVEIRYRLFCLSGDGVPRAQYPAGTKDDDGRSLTGFVPRVIS